MSSLNLKFTINTADSVMRVFTVPATIINRLPSNIDFVSYDVTKGGEVHYNDRLAIPERFDDPTPYLGYLNQWMAASAAATPALTMTQALAIKLAVLDVFYGINRQMPFTVSISSGAFAFDPSDLAVSRYFASVTGLSSVQLIPMGLTAPITLTSSDLQNVASAFNGHDLKVLQIYAQKKADLNALTTMTALIAYDATIGW
ncbi:hypothetical protein HAP48_0042375 [Bradyrhizobium septentrionale]|uniref:DUF4376 domain-containing protein n=1 Tax=Bradyrhizobium septentrionale TaxID=1404411 RepID=A0A973W2E6_9BRAD|nr:hypothetical protein [Bradyrhizobium septentrionale]UGY15105.1 hypothetical protein HAP48_0042375 [Bradyrhizobium septentrionale]